MALEHLIIASDFQDWGSPEENLDAIQSFTEFVESNYSPEKARIHLNGDLVDIKALNKKFGNQMQQILNGLEQDEGFLSLTEEEKQKKINQIESQISIYKAIKDYVSKSFQKIKYLANKGFKTTGVVGNNEFFLMQRNMDPKTPSENVDAIVREMYQAHGIETIDDFAERDLDGLRVLGIPYINDVNPELNLHDYSLGKSNPNLENAVEKMSANAIMLHGNPLEDKSAAQILKYLEEEYEGDTLWVFSGHRGKPGVRGRVNKKGSKVIYVNTNKDSERQLFYDAQIEDGKIKRLQEYEIVADQKDLAA